MSKKVMITGEGAICAAGKDPDEIWKAARAGRSAIDAIQQWDSSNWPSRLAGEIADLNPRALVEDRKLHKLVRRTDLLGLYAASKAIEDAGLIPHRDALDPAQADLFNDRTGVYVGGGGGAYQDQYDYFPLLTAARGDLGIFGRQLATTVNPMWLLRTLPNNVLCHIGIRYAFKGPNACITNHTASGMLAVAEAAAALRAGEADRAVAVGHDSPIEPETILYFHALGLLAADTIRPFDSARSGTLLGEGAAALVLETAAAARARGAKVRGEFLGSACVAEGEGLLSIRTDGDGLVRAIVLALEDAEIGPADVGMIVAHGNGTPPSDASEASAIRHIFGTKPPPTTAFKWAFGHLLAASGILDTVLALDSLRHGDVPGIATLRELDPACATLAVSTTAQPPRSGVALVLGRGFAGTNAALLLRASAD
ncbi:MAG: fabFn, 3-oxoacyl-ACP synthase, 3-oxoacyl-[acyl-carrier-protein] synthase I [candidate division NC10 bacterium CSP1-5]|nr:MAG: fabFn, 3-oxoacyl-ACP synthase, 3-oxoacyl-[acyl-carrier-protein] synthase I [candidate division NC10 bacterium CSP1-5]